MSRVPPPIQLKTLTDATARYEEALWSPEGDEARDYLMSERGFSPDTIEQFRLGFAFDPISSHEQARNKIAFPFLTPAGTVQIRFRKLPDTDGIKFWQTAGSQHRIYNTNALLDPGRWICVSEGEPDTIAATQSGLPCVGVSGANGWRPHFWNMLEGFERVIFLADNDGLKPRPDHLDKDDEWDPRGPGQKFAETHADMFDGGVVVMMPEVGMDVNDYMLAHGEDGLRKLIGLKE
jgi:DNA primase